jgi:hypothetical protein
MVLSGELNPGDRVRVDAKGGELHFDVQAGEGTAEESAEAPVAGTA